MTEAAEHACMHTVKSVLLSFFEKWMSLCVKHLKCMISNEPSYLAILVLIIFFYTSPSETEQGSNEYDQIHLEIPRSYMNSILNPCLT